MTSPHIKPFLCACGARFVERKRLEMHVNNKYRNDGHQCSCSMAFQSLRDLESHVRALGHVKAHADETDPDVTGAPPMRKPKHKCEYCPGEKLFRSAPGLQDHIRSAHSDEPSAKDQEVAHACPICAKNRFSSSENLLMHIKDNHQVSARQRKKRNRQTRAAPKRYICSLCGRGFDQELGLQQHDNVKHDGRGQRIGNAAEPESVPLSAEDRAKSITSEDLDGPSDDDMEGGVGLIDPEVALQPYI